MRTRLMGTLRLADKLPSARPWVVVVAWILLSIVTNVTQISTWDSLPSNHFRALPTADTATAYVVIASTHLHDPPTDAYRRTIAAALRDDNHVSSVSDLRADPITALAVESNDGQADRITIELRGGPGSSQAQESLAAVRAVIERVPAPDSTHAAMDGPATTIGLPLDIGVGPAALVCVLILAAFAAGIHRWLRTFRAVALTLFNGIIAFSIAAPVLHRASGGSLPGLNPMSVITLFAFTFGLASGFVALWLHGRRESLHTDISAASLSNCEAAVAIATVGAAVAVVSGFVAGTPLPAIRALGAAAGVGTVVATVVALTMLPATHRTILGVSRATPPTTGSRRRRSTALTAVATASILLSTIPLADQHFDDELHLIRPSHFSSAQLLPTHIIITSIRDLRTPAGLIAIDRVTRRIMEIPGIHRVESASWPAGSPWSDATFAHQAGVLGNQLQTQTTGLLPQVTAIKTMSATTDRMLTVIDTVQRAITQGNNGLHSLQGSIDAIDDGSRQIRAAIASASADLDPLRHWMNEVPNCAGDGLCSALLRIIGPIDDVQRGISTLSDGAEQIRTGSRVTTDAFATAPEALMQMKTALTAVQSVLSGLRGTVEELIPEVVRMSSYLRNVSIDFDGTGEGRFYMPQTAIDSPSYRDVKQSMFSPDGHTTQLTVYTDAPAVGSIPHGLAADMSRVTQTNTKYGALTDSTVIVTGAAAIAEELQSGMVRTVSVVTVGLLLAALLTAVLTHSFRTGLIAGLVAVGGCAVATGLNLGLWQHILHAPINRTAVLSAVAVALPLALARNILAGFAPLAGKYLTATGLAWGAASMLIADGAHRDVGQFGLVLVVALCVNSLLATTTAGYVSSRPLPMNR